MGQSHCQSPVGEAGVPSSEPSHACSVCAPKQLRGIRILVPGFFSPLPSLIVRIEAQEMDFHVQTQLLINSYL